MRGKSHFYWIWVPVLVVMVGVAQPLRASTAKETRAAFWTAVDATLRRIEPAGAGHYTADSPANRLSFRFGPNGVEAAPTTKDGAWRWSLVLIGYGAPEAVRPIAPATSITADDYRIEYRRGALTEWYDNRPEGLEQGFTLAAPPADGGNALVVALRVAGGLTPRLDPAAQILSFQRPDGKALLHYGQVKVSDAWGRSLPARLTLAGYAIEIHLDTRGAVWPVTVDPLVTGEPAELTGKDVAMGDNFGISVALSGNTALVGAYFKAKNGFKNAGAAYVLTRSGTKWNETAKLSLDEPGENDYFGASVALSADGDTALVGAKGRKLLTRGGAAYVFTRSGTTWSAPVELYVATGGGSLGASVALSADGNTALIGGPLKSGAAQSSGVAYVFKRSGTDWSRQKVLTPPTPEEGGFFGGSVALSGGTALVGAPGMNAAAGAVYVYSSADWKLQDTLVPRLPYTGDQFGFSVALYGDTALAGAPGRAAYVFTRSKTNSWSQQKELLPGSVQKMFGWSVALSGDIAVVGAPDPGLVYVYHGSGQVWTQDLVLPEEGRASGLFGWSVAISGDTALVGAPLADIGYADTFTPSSGNGLTPFAAFDVTQFVATAATHYLVLKTSFTLGQGSNGISPLKEPLILTVGGFTTTIPAGAFTEVKEPEGTGPAHEIFLYGVQTGDTWVDAQIIPMGGKRYLFQIWEWGRGVSLTKKRVVPVDLIIGDDDGTTAAVR